MRFVPRRILRGLGPLGRGDEVCNGQPRRPYQPAKRALCHLPMIGNGQSRHFTLRDQDDVAVALAGNAPAQGLEDAHNLTTAKTRQRGGHQAATSIWRVSIVKGNPISERTVKHSWMAS